MVKKQFSIGGTTQLAIIISILVLFFVLISPSVSSQEFGCCGNPGIFIDGGPVPNEFYCGNSEDRMLDIDVCCPPDDSLVFNGGYNASDTDLYYPDNQADCRDNYFSLTCSGIANGACTLGCCYNPSNPSQELCDIMTDYTCVSLGGTDWRAGGCSSDFNSCDLIEIPDQNETPPVRVDDCAQYETSPNVDEACTANSCFYCSTNSKCFSDCFGNCPNRFTDSNNDFICDPNQEYSACSANRCQSEVEETCRCGNGLALEGQYCCQLLSSNFTSPEECSASCVLDCGVGQKISSFLANYLPYGYTECRCGVVTATLSGDGDKYCCSVGGAKSLSSTECTSEGTLTGTVYATGTTPEKPIPGASVVVGSKSARADSAGKYTITGLSTGQKTAVAYNDSFLEKYVDITIASGTNSQNFYLDPFYGVCDNPKTIKNVTLNRECLSDQKGIKLSWNNPCPGQYVLFHLYRGKEQTPIYTVLGDGTLSFTDTNFEWEKNINYTLQAIYQTVQGNGAKNTTLKVFTGYEACLGNFGNEICNNNVKIRCDGNCEFTTQNCSKLNPPRQCAENILSGKASCILPTPCENLGNPLGVFYRSDVCYNPSSTLTTCYYDYSKTTIDKCYRCSDATSCASFLSQDACLTNPCGNGLICSYLPTNPELGKGICYKAGEFSSASCGLCNEPLMGCSSQDCELIGNCGMTTTGCEACRDVNSCEEYADEFSCTNGQPYQMGDFFQGCDVQDVTYSDDSCGIGYCEWDSNIGQCTGVISTGSYIRTKVKIPQKVLVNGDVIRFEVNKSPDLGSGDKTFYCISRDGGTACCPNTEVNEYNIMLSPENTPDINTGLYRIYYYSSILDVYSTINSATFYADMGEPVITGFDYLVEDYSRDYNSNLTIFFNVSEDSKCNGTMGMILEPAFKKSMPLTQRQRNQYIAKYTNLSDGDYHYTIECTDYAGNIFNSDPLYEVVVDRVGMIVSYSPRYSTLKSASMTITATLNDDGACLLSEYPNGEIIQMTKTQSGSQYVFTGSPTQVYLGSYVYLILCNVEGQIDTAFSMFTIDSIAPVSTLNHTPQGSEIEGVSGWYRNNSIFTVLCSDPSYPLGSVNAPPMFGCNGTRYCTAPKLDASCTPAATAQYFASVVLNKVYTSSRFCYQSKDAGANNETVKCTTVNVDSRSPKAPIVNVTPRFVGKREDLNISLFSTDRGATDSENGSGISHYSYNFIASPNMSGPMLIDWQTIQDGKQFVVDLGDLDYDFDPGDVYYVVAIATDNVDQASEKNKSRPFVIRCPLGEDYTLCNSDFTNCSCNNCGDEKVQDGEECDDGNNDTTDECTVGCKAEYCGDGYLYEYIYRNGTFKGEEECDDANNVSGDGCDKFCNWESCGDGIKQASEQCDDANNITSDSCINCYKAYCGDGFTYLVNESCDFRNPADKTDCRRNCTYATDPLPPPGSCTDGNKNGGESDVDCGGSCPKCGVGKQCKANSDCESGVCNSTSGFCMASAKCSNGVFDTGEASVDCGGICPKKCATGKDCMTNSDCESFVCKDKKCAAPTCSDGITNGNESDVDCGAACPSSKCGDGKKCKVSADCKTGICKSGYCEQNPDQDGDGIDDSWEDEYCDGDCDPDADPDKDGLTNLEEYQEGTDPNNPDSDGDGWKDGKEVDEGTDPLDPEDHPEGGKWWLWLLLFLILLIVLFIVFFVFGKSKKKEKTVSYTSKDTKYVNPAPEQPIQRAMQPQQPQFKPAPVVLPTRKVSADHSDIFKPFDDMYSEKVEGKETGKTASSTAAPPKEEPAKDAKKKTASDLEEGHDMPGWMKDRSGVWRRLEKMNSEELDRMGKTDVNVNTELSGMYGKRLDKNAKDSLSRWVLSGIITKENLPDIMRALAKEGKLNKSVLRYILEDMLTGKKMGKVEMKTMLREFAEKGVLTQKDSDDMVDFVKEL